MPIQRRPAPLRRPHPRLVRCRWPGFAEGIALEPTPRPTIPVRKIMAGALDPAHWYANHRESGGLILGSGLGRDAGSVTLLLGINAVGGLLASLGVASLADSRRNRTGTPTPRQRQVLDLIVEGYSMKQIAALLTALELFTSSAVRRSCVCA